MLKFSLCNDPLDIHKLRSLLYNLNCGGFVIFEGRVRFKNRSKYVDYLYYEGDEALSIMILNDIIHSIKSSFKIIKVVSAHRVGKLIVGDVAVWLGVASVHRKNAFYACLYIINELKKKLPIWKKEVYNDKSFNWINDNDINRMHEKKIFYYKQNKLIKTIGQTKLNLASILVIGAGALGCVALQYLAAAGIGKIGICDGDLIEVSNLHRQSIYKFNDCKNLKTVMAAKFISELNPFVDISIYNEFINNGNGEKIFNNYDLILDCTDNFKSKFLINDLSYLNNKHLIRASIYKFEGQIDFFYPGKSPCLRCYWGNLYQKSCINSCDDVGVIGVTPGILGLYQANEAIKYFLGYNIINYNETMWFNLLDNEFYKLNNYKDDNCILCGKNSKITNVNDINYEVTMLDDENDLINIM